MAKVSADAVEDSQRIVGEFLRREVTRAITKTASTTTTAIDSGLRLTPIAVAQDTCLFPPATVRLLAIQQPAQSIRWAALRRTSTSKR
jgi:hypothetical protein